MWICIKNTGHLTGIASLKFWFSVQRLLEFLVSPYDSQQLFPQKEQVML